MHITEWVVVNDWARELIKEDSIILEAGTADGSDTSVFCQLAKNGFVYGFEPLKEYYDETIKNISMYNNVSVENLALGEKTGVQKFYVSDRYGEVWGSSSLFEPNEELWCHPGITFNSEVDVNVINLDEWGADKPIEKIDLMWLDLQGAEPSVLRNAPNMLKKTKYLYSEVSKIELYKNTELYPDFKQFLIDNNFAMVFEHLPWEDAGNVLFKNLTIDE